MSRVVPILLIVGLVLGVGRGAALGQTAPLSGVSELVSTPVPDCDGVAVGDINDDGRVDLLVSSGGNGGVFWFEQGESPTDWQRHAIYGAATEIEGNDLADFDGDGRLEAISLDQDAGEILLHRPLGDPRGDWETTAIESDRLYLQTSLSTDLDDDGHPELVYTWEGAEPGAGGVHWLDFEGDAMHDPNAWTDRTMIAHESAWWMVPRRIDVSGDGSAHEILYTARNMKGRNAGARPGLFWIEPGDNPTARWKRHIVDTTLAHPLHVDVGQFSSHGASRDAIVGGFDAKQVHYYTGADSWRRHGLDLPGFDGESLTQIWNVKALPLPGRRRDAMLVIFSRSAGSAIALYQPRGGQYRGQVVKRLAYSHPMEDRLVLHDLTGDGYPEVLVPDSGGDKLTIFRIERAN